MRVINDLHLGVKRTAGTTPASQKALADWQFETLSKLLDDTKGSLVINGDLFDTFDVDNGTILRTYDVLSNWLSSHMDQHLTLVAGNHDLSKDSSKVSAFDLLAGLLLRTCSWQIQVVKDFGVRHARYENVYIVPHVANQDRFNLELKQVPSDASFVLLHANFDNQFAEKSDHSLNVSREQAEDLPGVLIFGHEHQYRRELFNGRAVMVGNQIPTSVSDCLGCDTKYAVDLWDDGAITLRKVMAVDDWFKRVDWRSLDSQWPAPLFVRVEGDATAAEAAEVITAIARYRAKSESFVITNAVKIEGSNTMEGVIESLEEARSFDIAQAIFSILDDREREVVKRLMGIA